MSPTYDIWKIFYVVSAYWLTSISLVFLNKSLFTGSSALSQAPLTVSWLQCLITVFLYIFISYFVHGLPFCLTHMFRVIPLSLVFVSMLVFSALSLKYLDLSFYYLARSLTIVFNAILTKLILSKQTSFPALLCCFIVAVGYGTGINAESHTGSLHPYGALCGLASSFSCAVYSILVSKSLTIVDGNVWLLVFLNNLNALFILFPLFILMESDALRDGAWYSESCLAVVLSGMLGFAITYFASLQIQVTSPLTHTVSGIAKCASQTVLAILFYNESRSIVWWLSNVVVLSGSFGYAVTRHREARRLVNNEMQLSSKLSV